jgi:hypothetical protein
LVRDPFEQRPYRWLRAIVTGSTMIRLSQAVALFCRVAEQRPPLAHAPRRHLAVSPPSRVSLSVTRLRTGAASPAARRGSPPLASRSRPVGEGFRQPQQLRLEVMQLRQGGVHDVIDASDRR